MTAHGYKVVPCHQCHQPWIVEDYRHDHQTSVTCPLCDHTQPTKTTKSWGHFETREQAAEKRSRVLAKEADAVDVYQKQIDRNGTYAEQQRLVDERLDRFVTDVELLDLKPIGSEICENLVDDRPFYADPLPHGSGNTPFYADVLEDAVEDDGHAQLGWERIADGFDEWLGTVDRESFPRGSVSPTTQTSVTGAISIGDDPISSVWRSVFADEQVQATVAETLRSMFGSISVVHAYEVLEERAIPPWIRSPIVDIAHGVDEAAFEAATRLVEMPDQPEISNDGLLATAALLTSSESSLPITVHIEESFLERERRKRADICDLLSILAAGFDVRVVGSGRNLWLVADELDGQLPGVSQWRDRRRGTSWVDDVVNRARQALDPDSRQVEMLRQLSSSPGQIMARADLEALHDDVGRARRSQILASESVDDSLLSLELIELTGKRGEQQVELLEPGIEVLRALDDEFGSQATLETVVSGVGNSSQQWRRTPCTRGGGRTSGPFVTTYMSHADHAAAAATAEPGSVTFVTGSLPAADAPADYRTRPVSYNADRDEVVAAPRAATPMEYTVTTAIALAYRDLLEQALPVDRLEDVLDDLDDPMVALNTGRQIGMISEDSLEDPEQLIDDIVEWGQLVEHLTDRLDTGDYDDRDDFCSFILRQAKGLEGAVVHLLDEAGVDVIREVRVTPDVKTSKLEDLAQSIGISAAISSTYGKYAAYRQLFNVPNSDPPLSNPTVSATDPTGEMIGSFVIRGPDAHRIREPLEFFLENPRELLNDPAGFQIEIPVTDPGRDAYREVASRILQKKRLRSTPETISLFQGLVATPHDLARALRRLPREDEIRELRPDDVRYALRTLEPAAILPDCGSAGKIVAALLEADAPLSKQALADAAGVDPKTVYNHRPLLEGLGLLKVEDVGYRLSLSFTTGAERASPVYPAPVESDSIEIVRLADAVLVELLPPGRYGDPEDPAGGVLFEPADPLDLYDHEEFGPWIRLAAALDGVEWEPAPAVLTMGPRRIAQQPLPTSEVTA